MHQIQALGSGFSPTSTKDSIPLESVNWCQICLRKITNLSCRSFGDFHCMGQIRIHIIFTTSRRNGIRCAHQMGLIKPSLYLLSSSSSKFSATYHLQPPHYLLCTVFLRLLLKVLSSPHSSFVLGKLWFFLDLKKTPKLCSF